MDHSALLVITIVADSFKICFHSEFKTPLLCALCKALHKAHNHPSGTLCHSDQDNRLSVKMIKAGKLFELQVMYHIILIAETHYSYANREGL
ncbi:JAB domain-containing protein [Echinicola rosea]|uniref:RadC-like JAB domain-containing protein n=1 Tax=Echinicola rosea TaxID=1807691 RepID=A0ABQ1V8U2_9BACT|nr:JAB domain-containing protein [Echinicola rosea]GGF44498.1 hypothetical protein GCM10011339_36260 [Echinicola rosea]